MICNPPEPPSLGGQLLTRVQLPIAASAKESTITDTRGREYLDASSGAVVSALGHGNSRIISAITDQLKTLDYAHRGQFHYQPTIDLARRLAVLAGIPDGACYFFCSGSEAVEAALKTAYLFQHITDGPRGKPASRTVSYHGATIEATRLTGHRSKRGAYDTIFSNHASFPPVSKSSQNAEAFDSYARNASWPKQPAALVLETMPGASAGAISPGPGYYEAVRRYCDETGSLWIADEVMTGMGRTGKWFAYQYWNAVPDVVCIGKGLGAGYWPISAIIVQPHIAEALLGCSTAPVGHTYSNHPAGTAAAHAVVDEIEQRDLLRSAGETGYALRAVLERIASNLTDGEVHGRGLFQALHFSGKPDGPSAREIVESCRSENLLVYEAPRASDNYTDAILIAPPLDTRHETIELLEHRLNRAFKKYLGE